jgi:hypothetical protein
VGANDGRLILQAERLKNRAAEDDRRDRFHPMEEVRIEALAEGDEDAVGYISSSALLLQRDQLFFCSIISYRHGCAAK